MPTQLNLYQPVNKGKLKFRDEERPYFFGVRAQCENLLLVDLRNKCVKRHSLSSGETSKVWKGNTPWMPTNALQVVDTAGDALVLMETNGEDHRVNILRPQSGPQSAHSWHTHQLLALPEHTQVSFAFSALHFHAACRIEQK